MADYRQYAKEHLTENDWNYIEDGSTEQLTFADNIAAFRRYRLLPSLLVNVSGFMPEVTVFGKTYDLPVGLCPTAVHQIAHPGGEFESIRAAQSANTIYMLSAHSSIPLEDVAQEGPEVTKWQQIAAWALPDVTLSIIRRAEEAGFDAIVVTIDDSSGSIRYNSKRGLANARRGNITYANFDNQSSEFWDIMEDGSDTWDDIEWIIQQTELPVILKGILTTEDALRAVAIGADGIVISNHGGR